MSFLKKSIKNALNGFSSALYAQFSSFSYFSRGLNYNPIWKIFKRLYCSGIPTLREWLKLQLLLDFFDIGTHIFTKFVQFFCSRFSRKVSTRGKLIYWKTTIFGTCIGIFIERKCEMVSLVLTNLVIWTSHLSITTNFSSSNKITIDCFRHVEAYPSNMSSIGFIGLECWWLKNSRKW